MKSSLLLACGLTLPVVTSCGSSLAAENVAIGTAAIEPGDTIRDCSSGGNTCSTTYPQVYCSADGETHFRDVTAPLVPLIRPPVLDPRSIQKRQVNGLSFQRVGVSTSFDEGFSTPMEGLNDS
jgi:hypothetical protein